MIFLPKFKQFSRISLLAAALLIIQPRQTKALDPITVTILSGIAIGTASGLLLGGIYKGLDILLTKSKDQQDYEERHQKLKIKSKIYFLESIQLLKTNKHYENAELIMLSNHELYRYENFRAAIKEEFPGYADYIKTLFKNLSENRNQAEVRGFNSNKRKKIYEFYELIKSLYEEIIALEQQEAMISNSAELCIIAAQLLLSSPTTHETQKKALALVQRALEIEPNNKEALKSLLQFNALPEKLVSDEEVKTINAMLLLIEQS